MSQDTDALNYSFEHYLEQAKSNHRIGNVREAQRFYYLAAEALLKLAQKSPSELRMARYNRAKKIIESADRLGVPASFEEPSSGEVALPVMPPPPTPLEETLSEFEKMIGLGNVKKQIRDWVAQIRMFQKRKELGLPTPNITYHLVFTGNPGTGKTTVARMIGQIYRALGILEKGQLVEVDRSDLVAEYVGHTAQKTKKVISAAQGGVLFIDEAYTLIKGGNDYGQEAVETLLKALEDSRSNFVCICAGYQDEMELFIRSNPGLYSRFKNIILFDDFSSTELYEIFLSFCSKSKYFLTDQAQIAVKNLFISSYGNFSGNGRDVRNFYERVITAQSVRLSTCPLVGATALCTIEEDDILKAKATTQNAKESRETKSMGQVLAAVDSSQKGSENKKTQKTAEETILSDKNHLDEEFKFEWDDIPAIGFDDIAGLDTVKRVVSQKVLLPLTNPEAFEGYVSKGGGGLFLYGPPGTGKTMVAAAIAKEVGAKFCSIKPSDLLHQGAGNTEKAVKCLFSQARNFPCAVLYFDEMDSICPKSTKSQYARQLRSELLSQLQGIESYKKESKNILFLIAATNKPWNVDSAFLRPGRFGTKVYVGLPDDAARHYLLEQRLLKIREKGIVSIDGKINYSWITEKTKGFNGADITNLLNSIEELSILRSIQSGRKMIDIADFENALTHIHSSVQEEDIVRLLEWKKQNDPDLN